jgi:hypothetical protein
MKKRAKKWQILMKPYHYAFIEEKYIYVQAY